MRATATLNDNRCSEISNHDYKTWRDAIRPALQGLDAHETALGEETYPIIHKEQRDFKQHSGRAAHAIHQSCMPEIKNIKRLDGPHECGTV